MVKISDYFLSLLLAALPLVEACDHHEHHHEHAEKQSLRKLQRRGEDIEFIIDAPEYMDLGFVFNRKFYNSSMEFVESNMRCRTRDLASDRQAQVLAFVDRLLKNKLHHRQFEDQEIVVNTYVHVVYKNNVNDVSNVPASVIMKQIKILNDAYDGVNEEYTDCLGNTKEGLSTPFRFNLKNITRTLQQDWHFGRNDDEMRRQLRQGSCSDLNIFISDARGNLGYATMASWCDNTKVTDDLVNINWQTLPDINTGRFSQGDTMVHEVGHWLGLEHTFKGGCFGPGDGITDTAPERSAGYGCVIGRDTCTGGGPDPIFNFMDYSDDCCMHTFSQGQSDRMAQHVIAYRNLAYTPIASPSTSPVPDTQLDVKDPPPSPPRICARGEMQVDVILKFDEWAEETTYEILEIETMKKVYTFQGLSNQKFQKVTNQYCLDAGMQKKQYAFLIKDVYGDGMGTTGTYEIQINSEKFAAGGAFNFEDAVVFGTPMSCPNREAPFLLILRTDGYGEEISWILRDETNKNRNVYERVTPSTYEDNTLYFERRCIPTRIRNRFAMRDESSDGICCAGGAGYFSIFLENKKLMDGGRFGKNIAKPFRS